jgi:hypothetical protein
MIGLTHASIWMTLRRVRVWLEFDSTGSLEVSKCLMKELDKKDDRPVTHQTKIY